MSTSKWQRVGRALVAWSIAAASLGLAAATHPGPAGAGAAPGAGGAIEGTVEVGPQLVSRRVRFNLYQDIRRAAPPRGFSTADELANVVVSLQDPAGALAARPVPAGTYQMHQKRSTFVPHVLPVPRGSTVEFPNSDPVFHNVFSLSKPRSFDLGRYPRGESRSVRFDEPGLVKVFCQIHSDMSAVVMVLPHRYFAQPDASGRFRIDGIPPGEYEVVAWHERARRVADRVRVGPGQTTEVDFVIPLDGDVAP